MNFLRTIIFGLLILSIISCGDNKQDTPAKTETDAQQANLNAETSSEIPELWEFHDVIYQIWHEAWPEKNIEMLKSLIPEIEAAFAKLQQASLPGILRDKQESWKNGIQNMAKNIETYKKAAAENQKESLLKAAEDLHTQFEVLVRLVRPVMKEIDQFHQELYMLYHYHMPEYNVKKIEASAAELLTRMGPIDKAKLPQRLQDKQQVFDQAKMALKESLVELQQSANNQTEKDQVIKAIEKVHDKYQLLIGVFE